MDFSNLPSDEHEPEETEQTSLKVAWPPANYRTGDTLLDAPVQATHLDAAGAKVVCAALGYFRDPWISKLCPAWSGHKSPLMHRGYYLRTVSMRKAVENFLKSANPDLPLQIVDLGCGLNTLYFWVAELLELGRQPGSNFKLENLTFFDVDFPVIIKRTKKVEQKDPLLLVPEIRLKDECRESGNSSPIDGVGGKGIGLQTEPSCARASSRRRIRNEIGNGFFPPFNIIAKKTKTILQKRDALPDFERLTRIGEVEPRASPHQADMYTSVNRVHKVKQLHLPHYRLAACDMRNKDEFKQALYDQGWNGMANTLFLSECVLAYMQPQFGDDIIHTCVQELCLNAKTALTQFVCYEQCNPETQFGRMMVKNLHQRGCPLMSIHEYKTIADQEERYKKLGFAEAKGWTMNEVMKSVFGQDEGAELKRIGKLEFLDEIEELVLFLDHYFLLVASNRNGGAGGGEVVVGAALLMEKQKGRAEAEENARRIDAQHVEEKTKLDCQRLEEKQKRTETLRVAKEQARRYL
eukprot:g7297.t1